MAKVETQNEQKYNKKYTKHSKGNQRLKRDRQINIFPSQKT